MAVALLMGSATGALSACASGDQQAEDQAVTEMNSQLTKLEDTARYHLRTSPNRDRARRDFALEQGGYVYASGIDGHAVTWSIALVGQGGRIRNAGSTLIRLRTCLQMRSPDALKLSLSTVKCPARFIKHPTFDSTDRDIDLLDQRASGGQTAGSAAPDAQADADVRPNEGYRERFNVPAELRAKAENHRERVTGALQKAVKNKPLDRARTARVLAPLGYDDSSVQAYGRSDGPGGLAFGISTDAGCVYGGIRGQKIVIDAGGIIADGGCLPAQGN